MTFKGYAAQAKAFNNTNKNLQLVKVNGAVNDLLEEFPEVVVTASRNKIVPTDVTLRSVIDGANDWKAVYYKNNNIGDAILTHSGTTLELDVIVPKELQGQGVLTEIYSKAIKEFNPLQIRSTWKVDAKKYADFGGESTNLTIYKQALSNNMKPAEAVFETPSGILAKRNGYDGEPIIENFENGVQVTFTRGN